VVDGRSRGRPVQLGETESCVTWTAVHSDGCLPVLI
jgi:hypothetical protein